MKTPNQAVQSHVRLLNPAGNRQSRRRWHQTRALWSGTTIAWLAIGANYSSYGGETLNWYFEPGLDAPFGTNTNGATVTEAYIYPHSGYYYNGTINAAVSWSDLSLLFNGGSTYAVDVRTSSLLDLWAYNQPGQTGPIMVTITPHIFIRSWHAAAVPEMGWASYSQVLFTLQTYLNGFGVCLQQYDTTLYGGTERLITVALNSMSPYTIAANDGDKVTFDMAHSDLESENWYLSSDAASVAWYTVRFSPNGYLSTGPREPANPPIPVLTDTTPQTTSAAFTDASHTQMTVSGIGGPANAPLPYLVMTSTTLAMPLADWLPCQTNNFASDGTFAYSFLVNAGESQRFFQLRMVR